jgi:hypothetical protein
MHFRPSVERILTVAFRQAASRRHTHVTVEHLLYALTHDPEGEKILQACGADLPRLSQELATFLDKSIERYPAETEGEPEQTVALRRVLQIAVLHVQSSGRNEVSEGDLFVRRHPAAAAHPCGAPADGAGDQPPRHPQLHLARHRQDLPRRATTRGIGGGRRRGGWNGTGGAGAIA